MLPSSKNINLDLNKKNGQQVCVEGGSGVRTSGHVQVDDQTKTKHSMINSFRHKTN